MKVITQFPELDNALVDPSNWADEQWVHDQFTWLRENAPLQQLSPEGFEPFWNVTRYNDIKEIEGNKQVFVNDPRPVLGNRIANEFMQQMTGRKHLVRSLVQMDDPDHMKYRRLTQGWFMGSNLRKLQGRVDELADQYVTRMTDMGGTCDFVKDVAMWFPLRVIMSILGVPEEDEPLMLKLTQELFGSSDPDVNRSFDMMEFMGVVLDFETYFTKLTQARRERPTDDVASLIANAEIDGAPVPEHEANGYYIIIATAGHDTTSASIAGGLLALLQNPEQMTKLRADTVVAGQTIRAGESALLWYPSANRDAAIFPEPENFRVDRKGAKQLAFGFGAHVCLGQHLARMEMSALFRALLNRVEHIELAGEPTYMQSTFVGGLKSLPIRYRMKS
jgi:cytochrome P450